MPYFERGTCEVQTRENPEMDNAEKQEKPDLSSPQERLENMNKLLEQMAKDKEKMPDLRDNVPERPKEKTIDGNPSTPQERLEKMRDLLEQMDRNRPEKREEKTSTPTAERRKTTEEREGQDEDSENSDIQEMSKKGGSYKDVKKARCPESNGQWDGAPGNSVWQPDPDYVPPEKSRNPEKSYSNPDGMTWQEILDKYGIDGIKFENGFPVFDEISKGTVEIEGFETGGNDAKAHNFAKADQALAEQRGCTAEEVRAWRKEHNYTWHECEDKKTMQKVPNEVHANVPHDGGRSQT